MQRLVVAALIFLAACSSGDPDRAAVTHVATLRHQALATRDIGLYLTLISHSYHDNGKSYPEKARTLADTLVNSDGFAYQGTVTDVVVRGDHATVRGSYTMRVRIKGQPLALQGEETILLQRERCGWRITGGL